MYFLKGYSMRGHLDSGMDMCKRWRFPVAWVERKHDVKLCEA